MKDEMLKRIENDIKSCSSFFYMSDKINIVKFDGTKATFLSFIIPSVRNLLIHADISVEEFNKCLSLYYKYKNEDE